MTLDEGFDSFDEQWSPRVAAEFDGQAVKHAKLEGEFVVVPAGVEHRPVADGGEAEVLLFEPSETTNTGNVESERTREEVERL